MPLLGHRKSSVIFLKPPSTNISTHSRKGIKLCQIFHNFMLNGLSLDILKRPKIVQRFNYLEFLYQTSFLQHKSNVFVNCYPSLVNGAKMLTICF